MDVLLRERRQSGTTVEFFDREVGGSEITIGSAPDQAIQVLGREVGPRHAILVAGPRGVRIVCVRGRHVDVNGARVRTATLGVGDRIGVEGHDFEIIEAPAGFDIALLLTPNDGVEASAFESAFRTRLDQALLGKRSLSWLLLFTVLVGALVAPLAGLMLKEADDSSTEGNRADSTIPAPISSFSALRAAARVWLPDDRLWSTGPLLPAHELTIGHDCSACHTRLFQRVQDEQCTECHSGVLDHVAQPVEVSVGTARCATCHKEHNDPRYFVARRDSLCTDCHAESSELPASVELRPVSGFSLDEHPPFDVHLLVPRTDRVSDLLSFEWEHRIESPSDAEEQSNLSFSHNMHLDGARVERPRDGAGLACGDCHVLSSDREHFLAIEMERHCQGCHELTFDETDPRRQLPHGEPAEVVFALEGHFMRKFGDPNAVREAIPPRRLPDRSSVDVCTESAYECAVARTAEEVQNQFDRRGCVTCHIVEDNGSSSIYDRFQVHPARLQTDYYPSSMFPHDQHLTQGDATGDSACLTCHEATLSETSADVLMPNIGVCLDCHGEEAARARVPLDCISCHAYHPRSPAGVMPDRER